MKDLLFENETALVLIVKNESPYISEWLEYHYKIGVDKFYIYDNDSEDREELLKILEPWIQNHIVDYKFFPGIYRQMPAYNDALENHRFDCRYMGFIDADEFIFVKNGQTLPELLNDHFSQSQKVAGLGINWRIFGSAGKQFYEPIPVVERFTKRAADNYFRNAIIKTIVNPRKILYMPYPHSAHYMLHLCCYDEHSIAIPAVDQNSRPENTVDKIQINHYHTKSVEEYSKKYRLGRADCDSPRSESSALDQELSAVDDVEFRDYCRNLKSVPHLKYHSELKLLENISVMLKSELDDVEKILTCFFVVEKINSLQTDEKYQLQDFLLEKLFLVLTASSVETWNIMMAVVNFPDMFNKNLPTSEKILNVCKIFIPYLIQKAQRQVDLPVDFYLRQTEKYLRLL